METRTKTRVTSSGWERFLKIIQSLGGRSPKEGANINEGGLMESKNLLSRGA